MATNATQATALSYTTHPPKPGWLDYALSRGRGEVYAVTVTLTPAVAAALLERNPDNRPLAVARLAAYEADLIAGRWMQNGEPLIVSRDGLLNDGQHRCAAVVASGVSMQTLVVFGVARETRITTNQGKAKGAADYAAMQGIPHASIVASIARMKLSMDTHGAVLTGRGITNSAVGGLIDADYNNLLAAATRGHRSHRNLHGICAPSLFGFAYYVCANINREAADNFFDSVATGEMLVAGDPAYAARSRMRALGSAGRAAKVEVLFHAWNAYRRGLTRTILKVTGSLPELV